MLNYKNLISYLTYYKNSFTKNEQLIATFYIENTSDQNLNIQSVANRLYVSTATLNRFAKHLEFEGYKDFIVEYKKHLATLQVTKAEDKQVAHVIEKTHLLFFEDLYNHLHTIDFAQIAQQVHRANTIYFFGFGKTKDISKMFISRLEHIIMETKYTSNFEHFIYTVESVLTSKDFIVVLYHHLLFAHDLSILIQEAKKRNIPIQILSIASDVDTMNYANHIKLFPHWNPTISKYAITMYTPFLAFIDTLSFYLNEQIITD